MITWRLYVPGALDALGLIPHFISDSDPRSLAEQLNENYRHGGGWRPFPGFTMLSNKNLSYVGDPPVKLLAEAAVGNETIRVYEYAWVAIVAKDGTFEVCRMD
jgi:hypothetical protein